MRRGTGGRLDSASVLGGARSPLRLLIAGLVSLALAGCGHQAAHDAARVANSYIADLQSGSDAAACALETSGTVNVEHEVGSLLSRYDQAVHSPCALEALSPPGDFSSPTPPSAMDVSVHDGQASVRFPAGSTGVIPNPVDVRDVGGHWLVAASSAFRSLQRPQAVMNLEEGLFSGTCLSAWNSAVSVGQVTLPTLPSTSQSVWATLLGTGTGFPPCTSMSIDDPAASYCESFIQDQSDGAWLQSQCIHPPAGGQLLRNVWLTSQGAAIPASMSSPDDSIPPLSPTTLPQTGTSPAPPTSTPTTTSPGAQWSEPPFPVFPTGQCGSFVLNGATFDTFSRDTSCATATAVVRAFLDNVGITQHPTATASDAQSWWTIAAWPGWNCHQGAGAGTCADGSEVAGYQEPPPG